jgi:hypothetical protein
MEPRKLSKVALFVLALVLVGLLGLHISYRIAKGRSLMPPEVAIALFKDSKIKNASENKIEVTGELFFSYLKCYLERLTTEAVRSLCTADEYKDEDKTGKSAFLEEVLKIVCTKLFRTKTVRIDLEALFKFEKIRDIVKDKLSKEETKYAAVADAFIFRLLKERVDSKSYSGLDKKKSDSHLKSVRRLCGKNGDLLVTVDTKGVASVTLPLHLSLEYEIFMITSLIPTSSESPGFFESLKGGFFS